MMGPGWLQIYRALALIVSLFLACSGPFGARAATPAYQGIYLLNDPYSTGGMAVLSGTAGASCNTGSGASATYTTPFCGDSTASYSQEINGIYFQINWCSWELSSVLLGMNPSPQTCYYHVNGSQQGTVLDADNPSTCVTVTPIPTYDTCSGSTLGQALAYVQQINLSRHNVNLPPLKLSIGLVAGVEVPIHYIYNPGNPPSTIDIPFTSKLDGNWCGRFADVWDPSYVTAYDAALASLISYINTFNTYPMSGVSLASTISIVKVSPFNETTNEMDMSGRYSYLKPPIDDLSLLPPSPVQAIKCPKSSDSPNNGAGEYLNYYNAQVESGISSPQYPDCRSYGSISQATECVLGIAVGAVRGTLKVDGLFSTIEAIPTNDGTSLPDIDCGQGGSDTCVVQGTGQSSTGDDWTRYYFYHDVNDLFSSSTPAELAAAWAFTNAGAGTGLQLTGKVATTWIALTLAASGPSSTYTYFTDPMNTTTNSVNQLSCNLNNLVSGNDATFVLNGMSQNGFGGSGLLLSWQTAYGQGDSSKFPGTYLNYCHATFNDSTGFNTTTDYGTILKSGIFNGGSYLEVQFDVAAPAPGGDLSECGPDLGSALSYSLAHSQSAAVCAY